MQARPRETAHSAPRCLVTTAAAAAMCMQQCSAPAFCGLHRQASYLPAANLHCAVPRDLAPVTEGMRSASRREAICCKHQASVLEGGSCLAGDGVGGPLGARGRGVQHMARDQLRGERAAVRQLHPARQFARQEAPLEALRAHTNPTLLDRAHSMHCLITLIAYNKLGPPPCHLCIEPGGTKKTPSVPSVE